MFYKILDYFFLIRPSVLIPCWTLLLLGHAQARTAGWDRWLLVKAFVLYSAIMAGVYILNQLFDIESDRKNRKLFLLSGGYIPVWAAVIEMIVLWGVGLFLALAYSASFKWLIVISLALGILYSAPPVKFKARPIADLLSNAIGYGLVSFLAGYAISAPVGRNTILYALPYVLAVAGVFVNTTIIDLEGDKSTGEVTTAVFFGKYISYILSLVLIILSLLASIIFRNYPCLITAAISLPLFVLALIKQDTKTTTLSFRLPPFLLALIAGYYYPPYLLWLISILLLMKFYYKKRFGYDYPKMAEG